MPEPATISTLELEIDAALERARRYAKYDRRVVKARYSKATDKVTLLLNDGSAYSMPRTLIQGLAGAQPHQLNRIQILSDGTGLLWPLLDVAHYVPGLLQGMYGSVKWMAALDKQRQKLSVVGAKRDLKRK